MAAPTATTRQTPAGVMLKNGYKALITFTLKPNVALWEKSVKPSGFDGGELIDITTMHNTRTRTGYPRALYKSTDVTGKAAYDPEVKNQIKGMVNIPQTITVRYRDGSTDAFYGVLRMAEFEELQEGTHPEMTYTVSPTNWDDTNQVEAEPVMVSVIGS